MALEINFLRTIRNISSGRATSVDSEILQEKVIFLFFAVASNYVIISEVICFTFALGVSIIFKLNSAFAQFSNLSKIELALLNWAITSLKCTAMNASFVFFLKTSSNIPNVTIAPLKSYEFAEKIF